MIRLHAGVSLAIFIIYLYQARAASTGEVSFFLMYQEAPCTLHILLYVNIPINFFVS